MIDTDWRAAAIEAWRQQQAEWERARDERARLDRAAAEQRHRETTEETRAAVRALFGVDSDPDGNRVILDGHEFLTVGVPKNPQFTMVWRCERGHQHRTGFVIDSLAQLGRALTHWLPAVKAEPCSDCEYEDRANDSPRPEPPIETPAQLVALAMAAHKESQQERAKQASKEQATAGERLSRLLRQRLNIVVEASGPEVDVGPIRFRLQRDGYGGDPWLVIARPCEFRAGDSRTWDCASLVERSVYSLGSLGEALFDWVPLCADHEAARRESAPTPAERLAELIREIAGGDGS